MPMLLTLRPAHLILNPGGIEVSTKTRIRHVSHRFQPQDILFNLFRDVHHDAGSQASPGLSRFLIEASGVLNTF